MIGVFLQVRLSSTRLPNKALLELGGTSVIEQAIHSLRRLPVAIHAVLTDSASAPFLRRPAERSGFELFIGSPDNVLERYVSAARFFGVSEIVRATGDNPLVSWELARLAVLRRRILSADYFGFDGPPLGTGVEVCTAASLSRALRETRDSYDTEHVTPYLYRNPERFRAIRESAPPAYCLPHARVTLDTQEDFLLLSSLYEELYHGAPVPVLSLIRHLKKLSKPHDQPNTDAFSDRA